MHISEENYDAGRSLNEMLLLRFEPIAVTFIKDESKVPESAIKPRRDMNTPLALCQGLALTRREKKTLYMDIKDHSCWNPLIGMGHVDCSEGSESFEVAHKMLGIDDPVLSRRFFAKFPRLPFGEYKGILLAPLCFASFVPDVVLIYTNNARLRDILLAVKRMTGKLVETQLDAYDSCVFSLVPTFLSGEYRVTLPDIGEYERAMAEEDEIIFSIPGNRMDELLCGLRAFYESGRGYAHHHRNMLIDYPRPEFYTKLLQLWGLD